MRLERGDGEGWHYGDHDFIATPHTPSVLHTNHEARHLSLKKYVNLKNENSLNGVYFHAELDTIYYRDEDGQILQYMSGTFTLL